MGSFEWHIVLFVSYDSDEVAPMPSRTDTMEVGKDGGFHNA